MDPIIAKVDADCGQIPNVGLVPGHLHKPEVLVDVHIGITFRATHQ